MVDTHQDLLVLQIPAAVVVVVATQQLPQLVDRVVLV
jgi:hypothetical protein